jgi:hypothetical protein
MLQVGATGIEEEEEEEAMQSQILMASLNTLQIYKPIRYDGQLK